MKNLFITSFLIFMTLVSFGQTCDIFTSGFQPVKHEITTGESVDLVFSIKNDAKGVSCSYHKNSVQVLLFLPDNSVGFESFVSPAQGKGLYFDWIYDAPNRTIIGLNHTDIPDGRGEENITVRVKAGIIQTQEVNKTLGLTILQNFEGQVFPSNNASNDNSIISLRIKSGPVQSQPVFEVISSDCNTSNVVFNPSDINDVVSFEVSRSKDGKNFEKIGDLFMSQINASGKYIYTDKNNLTDGMTYTYELTAVLKDGSRKSLGRQSVLNDCSSKSADFDFFPNPAVDKMYVRLKGGLQNKTVQMTFNNLKGEVVKIADNVDNTTNEILINDLPSGVYYITIKGNEAVGRKRFVKISQ